MLVASGLQKNGKGNSTMNGQYQIRAAAYLMKTQPMLIFRVSQARWSRLNEKIFGKDANPTDFVILKKEAEGVFLSSADVMEAWSTHIRIGANETDNPQAFIEFNRVASEYFDCYIQCCQKLFTIISRLRGKSQDPSSYVMSLYRADCVEYDALRIKYEKLGEELNTQVQRLHELIVNVQPDVAQHQIAATKRGCLGSLIALFTILTGALACLWLLISVDR